MPIDLTLVEEMKATDWLERQLKRIVFGRPNRGEPAYDRQQTFRSTYPKGYRPIGPESFNNWIRNDVYQLKGKKKRTGK